MRGRGFNNNDAITTASSRDPELWEITDCFPDMHTNLQTIPFSTAHTPRDIAYSPSLGLYVACCRANMLRSTNLITFNASYTGYNVLFNSIIWADFLGMFISVGSYLSTGGISTSTNATSWTTVVSPSQMIMTVVAKSEKLGRVVAFVTAEADGVKWSKDVRAQLKTMQELITLIVFSIFSVLYLKEPLKWNYLVGFALIVGAVFFVFKKW